MTSGTVSNISGLNIEDVRRAYSSRIHEMERDMKEDKEHQYRSTMMSSGYKEEV